MSPTTIDQAASSFRRARTSTPHIGLTEFARSKSWQSALEENGILEVTDRNETAAFLVSPQELDALMDAFDALENEIERMQIAAIFESRDDHDDWRGGADLARSARKHLESAKASVRGTSHSD